MRRRLAILTLVALAPVLMGAGGMNPPGFTAKVTGPAVSATVVMDPHMAGVAGVAGVTTTAKRASIRLQKGSQNSGAVFDIPVTFQLNYGCDLNWTNARFVYTPENPTRLGAWIPSDVISALFAQLGIAVSPTNIPVITDVDNDVCTPDPGNPGPLPQDPVSGIMPLPDFLSFQAVIQFLAPK